MDNNLCVHFCVSKGLHPPVGMRSCSPEEGQQLAQKAKGTYHYTEWSKTSRNSIWVIGAVDQWGDDTLYFWSCSLAGVGVALQIRFKFKAKVPAAEDELGTVLSFSAFGIYEIFWFFDSFDSFFFFSSFPPLLLLLHNKLGISRNHTGYSDTWQQRVKIIHHFIVPSNFYLVHSSFLFPYLTMMNSQHLKCWNFSSNSGTFLELTSATQGITRDDRWICPAHTSYNKFPVATVFLLLRKRACKLSLDKGYATMRILGVNN